MIPIPICLISRQHCSSVCIDQQCQLSPFICNHCKHNQCYNIHMHPGKQSTKKWTEIASLIKKYTEWKHSSFDPNHILKKQNLDSYDVSNQSMIKYLQNRQYSKIVGKSMRSFYNSIVEYTNREIQEKSFQPNQQNLEMMNNIKAQEFYVNEGEKMFKQKKYQFAIELFEKVIDINKNNHKAYKKLLNAIQELEKQDYFIQKYSNQIKINPDNPIIYIKRECMYISQNRYEDSLRDCDKAIQLDDKYSVAYNYRANIKYFLKQYQQAIMDSSKAIQLNPKARSYHQKNELQNALSDYNKIIELDQSDSIQCDTFNNRGIIYQQLDEIQKALSDYNKIIQLDPLYYRAYYNRAAINQSFNIESALEDYNKAIEINPKFIDAYYNRAVLYYQKQQYDIAQKDYNKAIQLDSNFWDAHYYLALIYEKRNELQKAINHMNKVIQLNNFSENHYQIGQWYFKLKNYELAEFHFDKYISQPIIEKQGRCYYYLGRIYLRKRILQSSLAYLEKSIQFQRQPQYILYLGIVRDMMQEEEQANQDYEQAFDQFDQDGQCLVERFKQIYKEINKFKNQSDK